MTGTRTLTFFHAIQSRATMTRVLLEELGAPYELNVVNLQAGENRQASHLAVNPMGKVPAIKHGDALITSIALLVGALFSNRYDLVPAPSSANGFMYKIDRLKGAVQFCGPQGCADIASHTGEK